MSLDCKNSVLSLIFFRFSLKSAVLSPKNLKKPILQNLQGLPSLKVLENRFFRFLRDSTALFNPRPKILGTVQHFYFSGLQKCCTVPKFLVPGHKNLGTVQHFCSSGLQKCCTVPKFLIPRRKNLGTGQHFFVSGLQKCCTVPNFFSFFIEKCCTVPKKPKKPILQNLQGLPSLKVLENMFFRLRDSTTLFNPRPKILGTVQHFCSSGLEKCCTVPKFLVPRRKNLGTGQHFFVSGLQKCCTVPNFCGFSVKSAVLSLKNNLFKMRNPGIMDFSLISN